MKTKDNFKPKTVLALIVTLFLSCAVFALFFTNTHAYAEIYNESGGAVTDVFDSSYDTYVSTAAVENFEEIKIVDSGKPDEESIVITIMGDGFTEAQQDDFLENAITAIDHLIGSVERNVEGWYPYTLFNDCFTVYAVKVISNESGVNNSDECDGIKVDNYFGSSFFSDKDHKISRDLRIKNYDRVKRLKKPNTAVSVVLCNSKTDGGTGGYNSTAGRIVTASLSDSLDYVLAHEFGHTFGLADEYYYPSEGDFSKTEAPNCTNNGDEATVKWKDWLGYQGVGIYPYSIEVESGEYDLESENWFKPSEICMMRDKDEFCPVCADVLITGMEEMTTKLFATTDIGENEIRIDGLNIAAVGVFQLPGRIYGKTVAEIGDSAFANQTRCTQIILPEGLKTISDRAFGGCNNLHYINIPASVSKIGDGAFIGCEDLNISVDSKNRNYKMVNGMLFNYNGDSIISACRVREELVLSTKLIKIAPYAFEKNADLKSVVFRSSVQIGDMAFADCMNLTEVVFEFDDTPPVLGEDVFLNDNITIYVPYRSQDMYKSALGIYSNNVTSVQYFVDFSVDGRIIETRSVFKDSAIENLPEPNIYGYDFGGWYDGAGNKYADGDIWTLSDSITLYAQLMPEQCTVIFDGNGGEIVGENHLTVTFDRSFTTDITANRVGYVLDGWYCGDVKYITADGRGTRLWDKLDITTVKARWSPKSYEIQINADGSIVWLSENGFSDDPCYIQYGTVLNAINLVATFKKSGQGYKEGKIFDHFEYDGSIVDWSSVPDLGENNAVITIIPVWINEVHTVYFNTLCDIVVNYIEKEYDDDISLPVPKRTGYTFIDWYDSAKYEKKIAWTTMPDLTPGTQNNGSIQLFAKWVANMYTVNYKSNGGSGTETFTTHTYNLERVLRTNTFKRTGHKFVGWSRDPNGSVEFNDGQIVKNLAANQGDKVYLYAIWQAEKYTITYKNLVTGMLVSPDYYVYGAGLSTMPIIRIKDPAGRYQTFDNFYGWYTSSDFTTKVTSISKTQTGNITLYAKYDYFVMEMNDSSTYRINDDGVEDNIKIEIGMYIGSVYKDRIKDTTLSKIKIDFSLDIWEVDDGYQHIYLYNQSGDEIWGKKIDHTADKSKRTYKFSIELNLADYLDDDYLYLRFDASGAWSDDWKFNNLNLTMYFTN